MGVKQSLVPLERIERAILLIRGEKVILDAEIAVLYEVETKVLSEAIKRHIERFPQTLCSTLPRQSSTT
jgi:hypothetical protein